MVAKSKTEVNDTEVNRYTLEGGTLTAREIFELGGPGEGTLDSLVRLALSARQRRLFACDCAERALLRARLLGLEPDPRSLAAVEVARRYAEGEGSIPELKASAEAARQAAQDACERLASIAVPLVSRSAAASWAAKAASRSAYYTDDSVADWAFALGNAQDASEAALSAAPAADAELEWQTLRALWYAEGEMPTP
jgi:hypothetical protein